MRTEALGGPISRPLSLLFMKYWGIIFYVVVFKRLGALPKVAEPLS